jgi:O-antigen/teichoic acid export membrane protein
MAATDNCNTSHLLTTMPKIFGAQYSTDMSNTKKIAKNSGWYGLENAINVFVTLFTSIAIARSLGPSKMGYIIYVMWVASMASNLGGLGIPATTRKYMAEYLGRGDRGTARYIYLRTLILQACLATLFAGGIVVWVLRDATTDYALAAVLIALSIWPSMVNFISAQANVASEELSANLPGSVASTLAFFLAIAATVVFNWGVLGIGASMLLMRTVDFVVRFFPTMRRILTWEATHAYPNGLNKRMMTFAWQSVASMIVALIVWDRSEFFLLRRLCSDIRQVAYYSVAFSIAERLLISASVFGSATGATIFAQYGRDKSRLPAIVSSAFRYLVITSIPLHFIASALAVPVLMVLYGSQYKGAAMVVALSPLLCMPKAFRGPIESLLECTEQQKYIILATVTAGIVDIGVAWWLIRGHGAVGACIGSGTAQVAAIGMMWAVGIHKYKVRLPWMSVAKVVFISAVALFTAHYIAIRFSPIWAIVWGGSASIAILLVLCRVMNVFDFADLNRFTTLSGMFPRSIGRPVNAVLRTLVRRELSTYSSLESLKRLQETGN